MDIRKLQRAIVEGLEDVKGHDIMVFNTEHLSPLFERVIIASGTSNRQTKALAASVRDAVKAEGFGPMRVEGEENGEWIIVDCGAAVVHVMQPSIREYYHLEEIWGDKPVKLKLGSVSTKLVKASEPEAPAGEKKAAARKTASKAAAPKAAPAKKAPAKKAPAKAVAKKSAAAAPAEKAVVKKMVVGKKVAAKKAPAKPGVTRTVGVKSTAAKKAAPKASPSKVASKTPAKTTAAKKTSRAGKA
jgi:ribosome-associated protein